LKPLLKAAHVKLKIKTDEKILFDAFDGNFGYAFGITSQCESPRASIRWPAN